MLDRLLPRNVVAVESTVDVVASLHPEEEASLGRAVEKRRREFVTGRALARRALERVGVAPSAIPSGPHGEPLWPPGVVGSITHCPGYRACAVARARDYLAIGIDAEVHERLPSGVWEAIAYGPERLGIAPEADIHQDRLLFCAKEAAYKAWFPLLRRRLGFEEVELTVDVRHTAFSARIVTPVSDAELMQLSGRWCVEGGVVATAVAVRSGIELAGWA